MKNSWRGIIWLILFSFQFLAAQEPQVRPRLVDSFAYGGSEDASARIDNWRNELNQSPQNRGAIIVYGAQIGKRGEVEAHLRGIEQAFGLKGIDQKRVTLSNGGFREKLTIEFWLIPAGADLPVPSPTVDQKKVRFKGVSRKIIPYECCF